MSTCLRCLSLASLVLFVAPAVHAQQMAPKAPASTNAAAATAPKAPEVKVDAASQAIAEAIAAINKDDLDGAIAKLTEAIKDNPKLSGPYVFRASVYCQKKMWPEAEADFKTALALDPKNVVIQFNVVEVKFMQKQYDAARAGYAPLQQDPQMGDLAAYKVFLCDLLAGHTALAKKERDSFDQVRPTPAYFFSNAAWELYNKNPDKARNWLVSVANIFPSGKITYYALPLKDLGWLPIAPPSTISNTLSNGDAPK